MVWVLCEYKGMVLQVKHLFCSNNCYERTNCLHGKSVWRRRWGWIKLHCHKIFNCTRGCIFENLRPCKYGPLLLFLFSLLKNLSFRPVVITKVDILQKENKFINKSLRIINYLSTIKSWRILWRIRSLIANENSISVQCYLSKTNCVRTNFPRFFLSVVAETFSTFKA